MQGLTELHCHILPAVDDGAATMREAIRMLKLEQKEGVTRIILTPHYQYGMFDLPYEEIYKKFLRLKGKANQLGIPVELFLAREYYVDSQSVEKLTENSHMTLDGCRYLLVEFYYYLEFWSMRNYIYELVSKGFIPIVAHIERYGCIHEDVGRIEELIRLGARIQVNSGAILGEMGLRQKRFCKKLMKRDYVHFIASDAHGTKSRVPNLLTCKRYVEKKMGQEYARRIFIENPAGLFEKN